MPHPRSLLGVAVLPLLVVATSASGVTITFEVRPDGTRIQNDYGCEEIVFDTFRPWGVLFTPPVDDVLDIRTTLDECLSTPNALGLCNQNGTITMTFVVPGTNTSTVADAIDLALLTATNPPWVGQVRVYNAQGVLLDYWALDAGGFCREPPAYYDFHHVSAPGKIARVECYLRYVGIDDVVVTEATTPVDRSTWGRIKASYP